MCRLQSIGILIGYVEIHLFARPGESDTLLEQVRKMHWPNQQVNLRGGVLVARKTRRSRCRCRRRRRRWLCWRRGRPNRSSRRSAAPLSVCSGFCASPCGWWWRSTAARCPSTAARDCSNWSSEVSCRIIMINTSLISENEFLEKKKFTIITIYRVNYSFSVRIFYNAIS